MSMNNRLVGPMAVAVIGFLALTYTAEALGTRRSSAVVANEPWSWSRVDAAGMHPSAREGHAALEVGNKIFIFGGCVQGIRCFNDVHIFDTDTLTWSQEPFTGDAPEPRGGHSAVLVGTDVFVFGGANSETTFDDAYKLDLIKRHWTRAVPSGCPAVPSRRTNHAAIADAHGRIYIVGGYDADSNFLNDVWIMNVYAGNFDNWQDAGTFPIVWEKPTPTGTAPTPREGHSLTLVDRKLILFGGYTSAGAVANDVYVYDLDGSMWVTPAVSGAFQPAPRQAHSAVRHGRNVIIAGGCSVSETQPECYNDVWSLDTVGMQWTRRSTDVVSWFAREGHSAVFVRGRMFTFGGCQLNSECFDDVAVLDTAEACAANCGGNGVCVKHAFCRCNAGFTGHDCMQPLTCPKDCSGHGLCTGAGTCQCANGWGGPDCAIDLPCPGSPAKCSAHGKCLDNGQCQCFNGFSGRDCGVGQALCPRVNGENVDCAGNGYCNGQSQCVCNPGFAGSACHIAVLSNLQETQTAPKLQLLHHSKNMSLAAGKTKVKHGHGYLPPNQKHAVPEPTGEQFGIPEVNDIGHTGVQVGKCNHLDNCNFHGVCQDGKCYCQPGYYGKKCGTIKTSEKGTVSLAVLLGIGGLCAVVSFSIMTLLLYLSKESKRQKERELGYNIR